MRRIIQNRGMAVMMGGIIRVDRIHPLMFALPRNWKRDRA